MNTRICFMIVAVIFLGGCATSNHDSASTSPPAAAPATIASSAKVAPSANPQDPHMVAAARYANETGYHMETRHGERFWCRSVAPIGSRLEEKQCLTLDGMVQAAQIADQNKTDFQQSHLCQGSNCTAH